MKISSIHLRRRYAISAVFVVVTALIALSATAAAYKVEDKGTSNLDGKVVMSPAAERVETTLPDGGQPIGPGSIAKRAIIIHNRTKNVMTADLDVSEVVGSNAELIVDVRHGSRGGAAAWVTLERPSVRLKPGQQATVGVTIRVPKTVKPGSKPFAVTATQQSAQVQSSGAGVTPQFKQDAIFIVELPGDAPVKGKFTTAYVSSTQKNLAAAQKGDEPPKNARLYVGPELMRPGKSHNLTLTLEYKNSGERLLRPSGKVVVKDLFGRTAGSYTIEEFSVYPGGEAATTIPLKDLPSLGIFQAKVSVESEAGGKQNLTLPRFAIVPKWFLLMLAGFALYGAYRLLRRWLARRREWQSYMESEDGSDAGEDPDWALDDEGDA